ncbi:MAG TPA: O-antigen ligase family protein [Bacteroidia bacterium]|nr:O-antigen ligase family protein [Bacteroidia bacterium]
MVSVAGIFGETRYRLFSQYLSRHFVLFLSLLFALGEVYIMVYKRDYFYPYNLLPLALFILYTAVFHLQYLVFFLAFATPLAISLKEMGLSEGPDLSIPTEPVMAGIMLMYLLQQFKGGISDKRFNGHLISSVILIQLVWMFLTTLSSTDFVVSLKYFISRLWFIFSCYLIIPHLFQKRENMVRFVLAYASAMAIVVIYTSLRHMAYNFNDKAADWVVSPFYNDHTAYGAALAMFIPVMLSLMAMKSLKMAWRVYALVLFCMFVTAIIISFARAGWLSLVIAAAIFFTTLLRLRFRFIVLSLLIGGGIFAVFQNDILLILSRNTTDAEGSFENNIESVSNISTDASNLERLNRWSCAYRMWEDKPLMGWGPGTYMFKYAPYQLSRDLTIISTNFGTNGNAHSEYLGPLAEQGVPGLLIVITLFFATTALGYRLVYTLSDHDDRYLCTGLFLGLMTYIVHGFFNNFLDTDKLSLPFWAFLAALVSFDIYFRKKNQVA